MTRRRAGRPWRFNSVRKNRGGVSIASRLHEHVDHVAVLVHGAPEILSPALKGDEELVQMPDIAHPAAAQRPGVVGPEGLTPSADPREAAVLQYCLVRNTPGSLGCATVSRSRQGRGTDRTYATTEEN